MDKLLGIGDNVVDIFVDRKKMYPGGNAFNVSVYAKMQGMEAGYFGYFGNDRLGVFNRKALGTLDIDYSRSRTMEGESGYTQVKVENGERVIASANKGGDLKNQKWEFTAEDLEYIKQYKVVHSSLNSYIEPRLKQIKECARILTYDFSNRYTESYLREVCQSCDVACISAGGLSLEDTGAVLKKILEFGATLAVGTMGEKGAMLRYKGKAFYGEAVHAGVRDTMGAGDAYIAALLTDIFLKRGKNLEEDLEEIIPGAMEYAAGFAAKICGMEGAFGFGEYVEVNK